MMLMLLVLGPPLRTKDLGNGVKGLGGVAPSFKTAQKDKVKGLWTVFLFSLGGRRDGGTVFFVVLCSSFVERTAANKTKTSISLLTLCLFLFRSASEAGSGSSCL